MKKFKSIKILSLLIIALLFSLISCSNEPNAENNNITGNQPVNAEDDPMQETTDESVFEIQPDLPDMDFGGFDFRILVRFYASENHTAYQARDIYAEEETGDPINDAVYRRNRYVEAKYNCNIVQVLADDHQRRLANSVRAGSDDYDLYYTVFYDYATDVTKGLFADLNQFPYIDLYAPWWETRAKEELSIGWKLYFCPSDLILLHNDSSSAIVFNKQLLRDYQMDDPYELVLSGKWTIDKLFEMTKDIYRDLNGDGIMDKNDLYGFAFYRDAVMSLVHSAGGRISAKDENDLPYMTLNSEISLTAFDKAFDLMYGPSGFNIHRELEAGDPLFYSTAENMFMNNQFLFYWILLHDVEKFRNMDSDFGILPVPKLTEAQEEYGSTVNRYHGQALAIPITVSDRDRVGIILEALTAKSKYTLIPEYYERTLQRKVSRDGESEAMLDIIFSSHVYDPGYIYNFADLPWEMISLTMRQNRDIASFYERRLNAAERGIERFITALGNLPE